MPEGGALNDFTVLFSGIHILIKKEAVENKDGFILKTCMLIHWLFIYNSLSHLYNKVGKTLRIAKFIVVPCNNFYEVTTKYFCKFRIVDR